MYLDCAPSSPCLPVRIQSSRSNLTAATIPSYAAFASSVQMHSYGAENVAISFLLEYALLLRENVRREYTEHPYPRVQDFPYCGEPGNEKGASAILALTSAHTSTGRAGQYSPEYLTQCLDSAIQILKSIFAMAPVSFSACTSEAR